jgi:hypothetical protein
MEISIKNSIVKRVTPSKDGSKQYVTVGDKDAVKEIDFSCSVSNVKVGYEGAVELSGADVVFMQSGGFISGVSLDPIASPVPKK